MNDIHQSFAQQGLVRPPEGLVQGGVCPGLARRFASHRGPGEPDHSKAVMPRELCEPEETSAPEALITKTSRARASVLHDAPHDGWSPGHRRGRILYGRPKVSPRAI